MGKEQISSKYLGKTFCKIPFKLPSLNEYIDLCRRNKYAGAKLKREIERAIGFFIAPLKRFKKSVYVYFMWIEKDMRRDADNIAFAKKFILDALVKYGKLKNDSRKYVKGFTDSFIKGEQTAVIVSIVETPNERWSK